MKILSRRILLVTDAWAPQVNGVVTTLKRTSDCLREAGHVVDVLAPSRFRTVPCPTYPEIRLALLPGRTVAQALDGFRPDAVHIATEGPLGLAARAYLTRRRLRFTTSYHTQFPEYVRARAQIPTAWTYAALRWFHGAASRVMVNTESMRRDLEARRFGRLVIWGRGVDTELFRPRARRVLDLPRPVFAYSGRVAVEKNLAAFLELELPGSKLVIGDGPALAGLRARFPGVCYAGYRFGEDLAAHLACADVFVFPSRTDTFGLVMLEALACGVPVAAFPVPGPLDVLTPGATGVLSQDLRSAALAALGLDREVCRRHALERSWRRATAEFLRHLVDVRTGQVLVGDPAVPPAAVVKGDAGPASLESRRGA
jgi:glycosyltransferase involved in cell wall biosynthesis